MGTRILSAAKVRIIGIWNYTEATWDEQQADKYVRDLVDVMQRLGSKRGGWKPVPDPTLKGVFFVKHASHFIFFKELAVGDIGVITVLHESMDIPSRLREDTGE